MRSQSVSKPLAAKLSNDDTWGYFDRASWAVYVKQIQETFIAPAVRALRESPDPKARIVFLQGTLPDSEQHFQIDKLLANLAREGSFEEALDVAFTRFKDLGCVPGQETMKVLESRAQTPVELAQLRQSLSTLAQRPIKSIGALHDTRLPLISEMAKCLGNQGAVLGLLDITQRGHCPPSLSGAILVAAREIAEEGIRAEAHLPLTESDIRGMLADEVTSWKCLASGVGGELASVIIKKGGLLGALAELQSVPAAVLGANIASLLLSADGPLQTPESRRDFCQQILQRLLANSSGSDHQFALLAYPELMAQLNPEEAVTILVPALTNAISKGIRDSECIVLRSHQEELERGFTQLLQHSAFGTDIIVTSYLALVNAAANAKLISAEDAEEEFTQFVDSYPLRATEDPPDAYRVDGAESSLERYDPKILPIIANRLAQSFSGIALNWLNATADCVFMDLDFSEELKEVTAAVKARMEPLLLRGTMGGSVVPEASHRYADFQLHRHGIPEEIGLVGIGALSLLDAEQRKQKLHQALMPTESVQTSAGKLIVASAQSLGVAALRASQLGHQYCETSDTFGKELATSYDRMVSQHKLAAWETIKSSDPALAQRIAILGDSVEGGSFFTVFEGWLIDGSHVAIKVLNPNALPRFRRMMEVLEKTRAALEKQDSRFKVGKLLLAQVEEWVELEFAAMPKALGLDREFRKRWHQAAAGPGEEITIHIPQAFETSSQKVWVEEWIAGQNFTSSAVVDGPSGDALLGRLERFCTELLTEPFRTGEPVMVPADLNPGNVRKMNGKNALAILDRQFKLSLDAETILQLQRIFGAGTPVERAEAIVKCLDEVHWAAQQSDKTRSELIAALVSKATSSEPIHQLSEMVVALAEEGAKLRIEVALLLKNAHGIWRMRERRTA